MQSAIDIAKQHPDAKREEFMRLFDQHRGRRTRVAQVHNINISASQLNVLLFFLLMLPCMVSSHVGSEGEAVSSSRHGNNCQYVIE